MPVHLTESFTNPVDYSFPHHRLQRVLQNPNKSPVVLVACGSFSPVTYLHRFRDYGRISESRQRHVQETWPAQCQPSVSQTLIYSFCCLSNPRFLYIWHSTSDTFSSRFDTDLPFDASVHMCTLAAEDTSTWLMVDPWEAFQSYQRTAIVLDHFDHVINTVLGGVHTLDGERRDVRVMLLAGSDLIGTMSEPGVWSYTDLGHILGRYGCFIIERAGTAMDQATDSLARWRKNIYLIPQLIQNDVSSTKVRLFVRRGLSVRYLLPSSVVDYIEQHGLYQDELVGLPTNSSSDKGKEKDLVLQPTSQKDGVSQA